MVSELALGTRLRTLRQARGLSLQDVATAADMSASFLSLVENDKSEISFGRLLKLVNFYGITITDLLPNHQAADSVVLRKEDARHFSSPADGLKVFILSPGTKRDMFAAIAEYEVGGTFSDSRHHGGEEFVYVLSGSLEFELEGSKPATLRPGDSVYYKGNLTHSFRNAANGKTRALVVVVPPNV
jgi:quercetin dioxygenase-like cupin family protein